MTMVTDEHMAEVGYGGQRQCMQLQPAGGSTGAGSLPTGHGLWLPAGRGTWFSFEHHGLHALPCYTERMTHRKPRRWTWAPLLLLCAVGAGVTAHAVAASRASQAQWIAPAHKTIPPPPVVPHKPLQPR